MITDMSKGGKKHLKLAPQKEIKYKFKFCTPPSKIKIRQRESIVVSFILGTLVMSPSS